MQVQNSTISSNANPYSTIVWDDYEVMAKDNYLVFQDQIDATGSVHVFATFEELCNAYVAGEISMS
jgi:hypothetical protein